MPETAIDQAEVFKRINELKQALELAETERENFRARLRITETELRIARRQLGDVYDALEQIKRMSSIALGED